MEKEIPWLGQGSDASLKRQKDWRLVKEGKQKSRRQNRGVILQSVVRSSSAKAGILLKSSRK